MVSLPPVFVRSRFALLLCGAYALVLGFGLSHHEMWRDELQAWLIARESTGLFGLLHNLRHETHLALWYLLLMLVQVFSDSPASMQVLNLGISAATVFLVARFSPLSRGQCVLFAFGYFPLFGYGMLSRSYALSLFLVVCACVLLRSRWRSPLLLSFVLALLAHTNVHSTILSFALAAGVVVDDLLRRAAFSRLPAQLRARIVVSRCVLLGAFVLAFLRLFPDAHTMVVDVAVEPGMYTVFDPAHLFAALHTFAQAFVFPLGQTIAYGLTSVPLGFEDLSLLRPVPFFLLGGLFWYCRLPLPSVLTAGLSLLGLLAFSYGYNLGDLRHHGFFLVACLMLLWVVPAFAPAPSRRPRFGCLACGCLTLFLALQAFGGVRAYLVDLLLPFSQGSRAAHYLVEHSLDDLPLLLHEDYAGTTVAGLLPAPPRVYYARGERAGTFVLWDLERTTPLREPALLERAGRLSSHLCSDVVLVLNQPLWGPVPEGLQVRPLVSFTGALVRDEDFHLYLFTGPGCDPV